MLFSEENFLYLVDFLLEKSRVLEEKFNVVNAEIGTNVAFTSKGASPRDIDYTLDIINRRVEKIRGKTEKIINFKEK